MKLSIYKGQSQVERMERERVLTPSSHLHRTSSSAFAVNYFLDKLSVMFPPWDPPSLPWNSRRKGIFAFLPGYESSLWTKTSNSGDSGLTNVLTHVMNTKNKASQPAYLLSFDTLPTDELSVFEFDKYDEWFSTHYELTKSLRLYFESEVPLDEYDGSYRLPEAICFSPILRDRLTVEAEIKDAKAFVEQLKKGRSNSSH